MTTILLIRHTEHELGVQCIPGRRPGVGLSASGRTAAAALAQRLSHLPIHAIYSSPLDRARQTAAALSELRQLPVQIADGLNEVEFGEWSGRTLEQLRPDPGWQQWNACRSTTSPPGGEWMLAVQARIIQELARLSQRHPHDLIAAVSHGDPIRAAVASCLGVHLDLFLRIQIDLGSISAVHLQDGWPKVLCVNNLEGIVLT